MVSEAELSPLGEASAGHGWTLFWCSKPLVMTVTVRHGTYHLSTRNGGLISGFIWENHGNIISGIDPLVMTVF